MSGLKLEELRTRAGLTREKLARMADISANSVFRYERQNRMPLFDIGIRMAKALNCRPEELIDNPEDQ